LHLVSFQLECDGINFGIVEAAESAVTILQIDSSDIAIKKRPLTLRGHFALHVDMTLFSTLNKIHEVCPTDYTAILKGILAVSIVLCG